ncbi:MAG: phytanoyl-CoA dioxygenase family protein [Deltaproteobacteria bacterium]|nr:phytanoyl-CoA dioxygenase family protein [Deltaproteobacteria bacterium]MBW2414329.1 phytanoyl-CoA dioxygenase family protein [Deltaproteobacteria bacterium]
MDDPLRTLTGEEIEAYDRDGVICARGLFDGKWLERMERAVDRIVEQPTFYGNQVSMQGADFSGDLFVWKQDDDFRDFIYDSPAARIANAVLRSKRVCFFYDQLFVKPPGCHVATPWHQDSTFWPIRGEQVCSIWLTCDPVTRESSGLEFVRGSHRWPNRYKAVTPDHNAYMKASDLEDPPDVEAHRGDYDLLGWDMERGDALIFNGLVVHGSTGNYTTDRPRRAFTSRWAGDDIRFDPRHPTMPLFWEHGLRAGDPLGGPLFPQILPETLPGEAGARAAGPEPPDPARLRQVGEEVRTHMQSRPAST